MQWSAYGIRHNTLLVSFHHTSSCAHDTDLCVVPAFRPVPRHNLPFLHKEAQHPIEPSRPVPRHNLPFLHKEAQRPIEPITLGRMRCSHIGVTLVGCCIMCPKNGHRGLTT